MFLFVSLKLVEEIIFGEPAIMFLTKSYVYILAWEESTHV